MRLGQAETVLRKGVHGGWKPDGELAAGLRAVAGRRDRPSMDFRQGLDEG
jgi:hypothetical protein